MSFLLLYVDGGEKFNADLSRTVLEQFAREKIAANSGKILMQFDYSYQGDCTVISVNNDLETIVIDGSGIASLESVVRFQALYPADLYVVDQNHSFNLSIKRIDSSLAFLEHIRNAEMPQ